ncbi:MAG: DUF3891 family protein [Dyadobacter sp.]|uniref:DUF3891 family protein n=1 Tax=Dyadobacter sp. TaxID=1914288 RepID=UPI003264A672
MIVTYTENGWSIVLQRSHGALAAQICGHWKRETQPKRWVETLIATADHDDVKDELSLPELIHKNGGPKNFKMKDFDRDYCDNLLEAVLTKGRYIGILIGRHIRFLYGNDPAGKQYCKSLKKKEKKWISEAGTTDKEISASYQLLEFCDAFSLLICQGLVQPENRKMEISSGPDGTTYQLGLSNQGNLIVTPWPFEGDHFTVNYESRHIRQLTFESNEEFRAALNDAPVQLHTLIIAEE